MKLLSIWANYYCQTAFKFSFILKLLVAGILASFDEIEISLIKKWESFERNHQSRRLKI